MKKGFTLIELLAVIIILGVIFTFIFPKVSGLMGIGKNRDREISESIIMDAAKEYSTNDNTLMNGLINQGDRKCITVQSLIDNGYIKQEDLEKVSINISSKVKVELDENENVEYAIVSTCTEQTSAFNPPEMCTYNGTLTQGAEYIQGQYTYRYMQESSATGWTNMTNDGWGAILTDKNSTAPITAKMCSYINNKPIVSTRAMFYQSKAISINLSGLDTSNVVNMRGMFKDCEATRINLGNINTSNVTNMMNMFQNIKATTLDLRGLDTRNVITMQGMFRDNTTITTLDLSSFDMSNVSSTNGMFRDSTITTGYAKTQTDADILNASTYKPAGLTFVVK